MDFVCDCLVSMKITRTTSDNADFRQLITLLDRDVRARYGDLQDEYDKYNIIPFIETVIVVYIQGVPIACGCFKSFDENTIEIKRMFVHPDHRGKGISRSVLRSLEEWAREFGCSYSILETAIKQPEAIGLYKSAGYKVIDNYGPYVNMSNSICFKKRLVIT